MKRSVLIVLSLIPGLAWLIASGQVALQSGGNSDVYRQWVTSQYVMQGIDPYRVSFETLRLNYGETRGPNRLRLSELKIYEVHPGLRTDNIEGILPELGPPTATYPPSSLLMLVGTVGQIPQQLLLPIWLAVNLVALVFFVFSLCKNSGGNSPIALLSIGALTLLWPPTQELFRTSQFGFLVIIWLIAALRYMPTDSIRSGLFFSLSLLKPSLVLPFLILPLIRKRWMILAVVAVVHGTGTLIMSALLHTPPWTLLSEWMEIPRYMLQGAYTIQEIVNRLGMENSALGFVVTLGFVAAAALWCFSMRQAKDQDLVTFLCFVSLLWTYHERYDFVLLLMPAAAAVSACARLTGRALRLRATWCLVFVVLGIALSDPPYLGSSVTMHVVRWAGRISLLLLFGHSILALRPEKESAQKL